MRYWYIWDDCVAQSTRQVLMATLDDPALGPYKGGECGSFTRFFLDLLKIHGIETTPQGTNDFIFIVPTNDNNATIQPPKRILVKNWEFPEDEGDVGAVINDYFPGYTHANLVPQTAAGTIDEDALFANNTYNWVYSEFNELPEIMGQGNENPRAHFNNHQIARSVNTYYDVAYGTTYEASPGITWEQDMENQAIDGYGFLLSDMFSESQFNKDFNGDNNISTELETMIFYVVSKNKNLFSLEEEETNSKEH